MERCQLERWGLPLGVSVSVRGTEDYDMVFAMNFSDAAQELPLPERYRRAEPGVVLKLEPYEVKTFTCRKEAATRITDPLSTRVDNTTKNVYTLAGSKL